MWRAWHRPSKVDARVERAAPCRRCGLGTKRSHVCDHAPASSGRPHPRRLLISIPLSYSGGIIAAKQEIRQYPTRTNQIPRHIPPPHWASHPLVLFFAAGLLPFGTIFVELYFAMTSMWQVCLCVCVGEGGGGRSAAP